MITNVFENLQLDHGKKLYNQIRNFIIDMIEAGELKEGDQLPSEMELCHILHVSRPPIRQAFSTLVDEGYLLRKKRGGTFIRSNHVITSGFDASCDYHRLPRTKGVRPYTELLKCKKVKGNANIRNCLDITNSNVIYLERLRYVDQKPIAHIQNYLSYRRFPKLMELDLNNVSLYNILKHYYGIEPHHVNYDLQAIQADKTLAKLFQIDEGTPILRITTVTFTQNNVVFDYSIEDYIGSSYVFHVDKMPIVRR